VSAPAARDDGTWSADEMMTVAAARQLHDGEVCFVGIGLPSTAANLARRTHAPGLVLVYESGTIGAKPRALPLSIGDGELAETADAVVSVPEIFNYWLQAGRIDVGFLGAAELDRRGDINTTVIGPYGAPKVRLPGAGGAPEIAASCRRVVVVVRQSPRAFVERVGFRTSTGERVTTVITDLGVLTRRPGTGDAGDELVLTRLHPGATVDAARAATGWDLTVADDVAVTARPSATELGVLRELEATKGAAA
jgi:glutaconate CoA-transferase subunit B